MNLSTSFFSTIALNKSSTLINNGAHKLYIKNMVSNRCKLMVEQELAKLGLHTVFVELGGVEILENISTGQYQQIKTALSQSGLELLHDKKSVLIEKIKNVIIEFVHHSDEKLLTNFSNYLSKKLHYDYTYLANLFSEEVGITIAKFLISHKIARVKELIVDDELNLTEIASKLHYSSVAHLSNQFKKVTGFTPSKFKRENQNRIELENV